MNDIYIHGGIMFGYVFPDKPELKIKEFELFRAYYCGLCKAIGNNIGQVSRLVLNYDSSFLGMFLSSFKNEGEKIIPEKCIIHPLNRKPMVKDSPIIDYAADMNIILAYYKLKDDWADNRSIKAKGAMDILYPGFRKAKLRNTTKADIIKERLSELSSLEKDGCSSADMAAEPFAQLTAELFLYAPISSIGDNGEKLKMFGYNLGKWIYLLDAYNDVIQDIKDKSYNPLLRQFNYNGEDILKFKERVKDNISFTLTYTLSEAGKYFEMMDIRKNRPILENVIYGGMYNKTLKIIGQKELCENEKPI